MVLVLIFVSNQFVRYLGQAAGGHLPGNILLEVTVLAIPHLLGLLLPLAFYLATLLALGRMYSDSEMTVLQACGLSQGQLLWMYVRLALVLCIVVAILNLWVTPWVLRARDQLLAHMGITSILQTILPGRFQAAPDGKHVFYLADMSRNRQHMQNVFMAELTSLPDKSAKQNKKVWTVMSAEKGYQAYSPLYDASFIEAKNGYRYIGIPGRADYRVMKFGSYGLRVQTTAPQLVTPDEATLPTKVLWHKASADKPRYVAELQWRMVMPVSVLLLMLIAIPLARMQPRKGRFSQMLPGILLCVIYVNFLLIARAWVQKSAVATGMGLWWVQGLLLVIAAYLWGMPSFFAKQKRYFPLRSAT